MLFKIPPTVFLTKHNSSKRHIKIKSEAYFLLSVLANTKIFYFVKKKEKRRMFY
jgi:hypothetical protein